MTDAKELQEAINRLTKQRDAKVDAAQEIQAEIDKLNRRMPRTGRHPYEYRNYGLLIMWSLLPVGMLATPLIYFLWTRLIFGAR